MYRSISIIMIGLVAALTLTGPSSGDTDDLPNPIFWTWQEPQGEADDHDNIIGMLTTQIVDWRSPDDPPPLLSPETVAFNVCKDIHERELTSNQICILLVFLGRGDGKPWDPDEENPNNAILAPALFEHYCDSLKDDDNPEMGPGGDCPVPTQDLGIARWWWTPWMPWGVEETGGWMADFIKHYKTYQKHPSLLYENAPNLLYENDPTGPYRETPDPIRFHFDTEKFPRANHCYSLSAFNKAYIDDRWDDDADGRIYGFEDDGIYNMKDLWDNKRPEGVNRPDENCEWCETPNRPWVNWYFSSIMQMCDGAMSEAVYDKIHDAWPNAQCSDYRSSCKLSGSNYYVSRQKYGGIWGNDSEPWCQLQWQGSADLQAPVFYPVHVNHQKGDESQWEATMRVHRHNLNALINSLDEGDSPSEITPWIANIGATSCEWSCEVGKDNMREMLTMLRSRRLQEFLLWNGKDGTDEDDWDEMADVIDQVWMYDLTGYEVSCGVQSGCQPVRLLRHALDDYFVICPENVHPQQLDTLGKPENPRQRGSARQPKKPDEGPGAAKYVADLNLDFTTEDYSELQQANASLDVTVEARLPQDGPDKRADMKVYLKNWTTGDFLGLDGTCRLSNSRESIHVATASSTSGPWWIKAEDGSIRVQIHLSWNKCFTALIDSVMVVEAE